MPTETLSSLFAAGILAATIVPGWTAAQSLPMNATVYASGLEAPRGLRFGPDGDLYVAEAGTGGSIATGTACTQVPGPIGPYTGGTTSRISKISSKGVLTTVAAGFPSAQDAVGDLLGVADVAFVDGTLYALINGGGCSHGNPTSPNGIAKVDVLTGKWSLIADIGAYVKAHPTKYESADDFEPDGTPYSFFPYGSTLYTVEANHGEVLAISIAGKISQMIDVSASQGHIVPTTITGRDGLFYLGNLNLFPIDPQWARIQTITKESAPSGAAPGFEQDYQGYHIVDSKAGFTTILALKFGPDGLLYALELSAASGYPTPGQGKVVRVLHSGAIEDVVTGLVAPTGMQFGPDGALYVSNYGAVPAGPKTPTNLGQILRITITPGY